MNHDDGWYVGTCHLGDRRTWAAWVVDRDARPLWRSMVRHPTEAAARAAGERALTDLRRGATPTER